MRIAFFVQYCDRNGTFFRWHNLAIALKQLGHEVDVYASDHNWRTKVRKEKRDEIDYYITPSFFTARLFYAPNDVFSGLRRLHHLPQKEYEVYHLYQPFLHAFISWYFLKQREKNALFIYDWDDLWIGGLFQKMQGIRNWYLKKVTAYLEKSIPALSDGVTVCSQFLYEKIEAKVAKKIIGNGFWKKEIPDKVLMRKKWSLSEDIFYIAYIGKTANELNWAIDAIKHLNSISYGNIELIIAGPPKNYFEQLVQNDSRNIIYYGELKVEEARELSAAADLGLIPLEDSLFNRSRFPIKFFDFLSVNTPVYLSGVGEIALLASNIKNAYVGPCEKKTWSAKLSEIIDDVKKKKNVIDDVAFSSLEMYTWPSLARQQTDFYYQLQKRP